MLPIASTTITLLSTAVDDWGGESAGTTEGVSGVRAHFSSPGGSFSTLAESSTATSTFRLVCDAVDLQPSMLVRDETTGAEYRVDWVQARPWPLSHLVAGVTITTASH